MFQRTQLPTRPSASALGVAVTANGATRRAASPLRAPAAATGAIRRSVSPLRTATTSNGFAFKGSPTMSLVPPASPRTSAFASEGPRVRQTISAVPMPQLQAPRTQLPAPITTMQSPRTQLQSPRTVLPQTRQAVPPVVRTQLPQPQTELPQQVDYPRTQLPQQVDDRAGCHTEYLQRVAQNKPLHAQGHTMTTRVAHEFLNHGLELGHPDNEVLSARIDALHETQALINAIEPYFEHFAGSADGRLDYNGVLQFFYATSADLLGYAMGNEVTQMEFMRFDFHGDGQLNFKEVNKMFKCHLLELQKKIGHGTVVPVPYKTPEEAGYEVMQVLAEGGQGSVSLANCSRGRVALKTYDKNNENACTLEELRSEMQVMQEMEMNPHIMHCFEIFQDQYSFYCVDELLDGGDLVDLRENCSRTGIPLTDAYFCCIFSQCVGALEYMHRHAMMHCDIKEPNIMVKTKDYQSPEIALIDFGMSKWASSDGLAGGTPGYRPPETNDNNMWFPRGDIFSMGVVMFQLLADKVPNEKTMAMGIFTEGCSTMEDVYHVVKTRQPPWHLIQNKYPGVMSFLPSTLEKKMFNRPHAAVLLEDPWFSGIGAAADAVMPETQMIMPQAEFGSQTLDSLARSQRSTAGDNLGRSQVSTASTSNVIAPAVGAGILDTALVRAQSSTVMANPMGFASRSSLPVMRDASPIRTVSPLRAAFPSTARAASPVRGCLRDQQTPRGANGRNVVINSKPTFVSNRQGVPRGLFQ